MKKKGARVALTLSHVVSSDGCTDLMPLCHFLPVSATALCTIMLGTKLTLFKPIIYPKITMLPILKKFLLKP